MVVLFSLVLFSFKNRYWLDCDIVTL